MGERGAGIGLIAVAVGLFFTLPVLSRGGGYFAVVHDLQWFVPLLVVGTATALAAGRPGRANRDAVLWLLVVCLGGTGWNFLVYVHKLGLGVFGLLLPLVHPIGIDLHVGIFAAGKSFSNVESGYPPFTLWLGKAFTAVSFSTAYVIQVCLLVGFAVGSAVLCALLARAWLSPASESRLGRASASGERLGDSAPFDAWQIGLLGGLWLLTSYGFMFQIERGQLDLYALFFALLAVWLLLRRPQVSPWWPSLALALAVNIKAYPAVLAVVLLWRYRWRAVLPLLVTNLVLLLCAGPGNLRNFVIRRATLETSTSSRGWVNHSAWSLAHALHEVSSWPSLLGPVFFAASVLLWIVTFVVVMRRGWSARRVILVSAACVPVMCTVTSISNDYRLVLLVFPLSVLAAVTAAWRRDGGRLWALMFMAVGFEFFLLARSSRLVAPSLQGSKFALIAGLQVLLLIVAAFEERSKERARVKDRVQR